MYTTIFEEDIMPKGRSFPLLEVEQHLLNFKSANLSPTQYCRQQNIPLSTFRGWQKKFSMDNNRPVPNLSKRDFLKLPSSPVSPKMLGGSVKLSQTSVEFSGAVSASLVHGILSALKFDRVFEKW